MMEENIIINEEDIDINLIKKYLESGLFVEATFIIKEWLRNNGKLFYGKLLSNLIKIHILDNDLSFNNIYDILEIIKNGHYKIDANYYENKFRQSLSNNQMDKAFIYYKIINKYDRQRGKKLYHFIAKIKISNKTLLDFEQSLNETNVVRMEKVNTPLFSENEAYLKGKINSLNKDNPLVITKPMIDREIDSMKQRLDQLGFSDYLTVGITGQKMLALIYRNPRALGIHTYLDIIRESFKNKDYDRCIRYGKQLIARSNNLKAQPFYSVGIAYLKKNDINNARNYLLVSQKLNELEKNNHDLSDFICQIEENDILKQRPVRMMEEEFKTNNFEIKNFSFILYNLIRNNYDFDRIKIDFKLSDNDLLVLKLMTAREFYSQGYYNIGDKLIKEVEKSKNKSYEVKKLLFEIPKNKKFYINRKEEFDMYKIKVKA